MKLHDIHFPIYRLGSAKPVQHEGISFFLHVKDHDDKAPEDVYLIVDDKNIPGDSLARRRLQLAKLGVVLFKLSNAIFFIADMLKFTKGTTWFIDSSGFIFEYKKTKTVPLIFKKVSKLIPINTGGAIVEVEGMAHRFKILFMPTVEQKYVGLLKLNKGYILYGLYDKLYNNTVRMI